MMLAGCLVSLLILVHFMPKKIYLNIVIVGSAEEESSGKKLK
jgi:hypothetical protein